MEVAVGVKSVDFSYGSQKYGYTNILSGINVNVPKGKIYGLLGPSGCGKTSLLKVMCGILKPKSGSVSIFGFQPGTKESGIPGSGLGYMPQEYALPPSLTIEETFYFFGRLYLMSNSNIQYEMETFSRLLHLPPKSQQVDSLSGGEKQRVSLTVALFHKPRLVILDEPTVGIDPLLREVVWEYLNQLSEKEQTTFIITTHYIEELKRAARIGFMRKGRIICENSPKALVKKFEVNNLEEIFYRLSKGMKTGQKPSDEYQDMTTVNDCPVLLREEFMPPKEVTKLVSFYSICASLFGKSMKTTLRQPGALIVNLLIVPLLLWFANVTIGRNPTNLQFAYVVDKLIDNHNLTIEIDKSTLSEFGNATENENWQITNDKEDNLYLPDVLRQFINRDLITLRDEYKDLRTAIEDIKQRKLFGALYFGPHFSESYIQTQLFNDYDWIENETIEESRVHLYIDETNTVLNDIVTHSIDMSLNQLRTKVVKTVRNASELSNSWIDLGQPIYGEFKPDNYNSFRYSFILGVTVQLIFATSFEISAFGVYSELESNLYIRNRLAGVTSSQMVISNIFANAVFLVPNTLLLFLLNVFIVQVPFYGSTLIAIALLSLQSLIGICFGIFAVTAFKSLLLISGLVTAIAVGSMLISGAIWPSIAIAYYFRWCAQLLPFSTIAESLMSIFLRADAPFMSFILPGFTASISLIIVVTLMSVIVLNSKS